MSEQDKRNPPDLPLPRTEGVTPTELYLQKLCEHSFLTLRSYAGAYKDQGRTDAKGNGKELCDPLVVFQNHILNFQR